MSERISLIMNKNPFETSFIGGIGLKTGLRAAACGSVDELSAFILLSVSLAGENKSSARRLLTRCNELISLGTDLASLAKPDTFNLSEDIFESLLTETHMLESSLPPVSGFLLPCESPFSSALNLARTHARKAEREVLRLMEEDEYLNPVCCRYLNLISTYLFAETRLSLNKRED